MSNIIKDSSASEKITKKEAQAAIDTIRTERLFNVTLVSGEGEIHDTNLTILQIAVEMVNAGAIPNQSLNLLNVFNTARDHLNKLDLAVATLEQWRHENGNFMGLAIQGEEVTTPEHNARMNEGVNLCRARVEEVAMHLYNIHNALDAPVFSQVSSRPLTTTGTDILTRMGAAFPAGATLAMAQGAALWRGLNDEADRER